MGQAANGPVAVVGELLNEWQLPVNKSEAGNDGYVGGSGQSRATRRRSVARSPAPTRQIGRFSRRAERDALVDRTFEPVCDQLLANATAQEIRP